MYIIGGYDSNGPVYHNSNWCFNLTTKEWNELSPMLDKRCYIGTVLLENRIIAVGGHDGRMRHRSVEEYDLGTNQWYTLPHLNTPRSDLAVVVLQNKVYAIGGFSGQVIINRLDYKEKTKYKALYMINNKRFISHTTPNHIHICSL